MAQPISSTAKKIVVLGAGYGGTYTFKKLHQEFHGNPDVALKLVSKTNYFVSTPLLHEVATGSISPEHIVEPLRKVLNCVHEEFLQAQVKAVSLEKRIVETSRGPVPYDYLVLALGAEINYRGTKGAAEFTRTLKSLEDAIVLKNRFVEVFERATTVTDETELKNLLHFVVIGGGATGVELATEMMDLFKNTFAKYYSPKLIEASRITLIHAGDELLANFSENIRGKTKRMMRKKGIEVRLGLLVSEITKDSVSLNNGETISADTIIWAAGVKPADIAFDAQLTREQGRILVNSCLQIPGHPEVFVLGDMAAFHNPGEFRAVPMLAQVAHRQSVGVARNVSRLVSGQEPLPYEYKHMGDLVSLGDWVAAGELFGVRLFGHITWFIWRGVYLAKLLSVTKRAKVLLDWIVDLFIPREVSEIYQCPDTHDK